MEDDKDKKYEEIASLVFREMMFSGRSQVDIIASAITLLKEDLDSVVLSDDTKNLLNILVETTKKHKELFDWAGKEFQKYRELSQKKTGDS